MASRRNNKDLTNSLEVVSYSVFTSDTYSVFELMSGFKTLKEAKEYATKHLRNYPNGLGIAKMIGVVKPEVPPYVYVEIGE